MATTTETPAKASSGFPKVTLNLILLVNLVTMGCLIGALVFLARISKAVDGAYYEGALAVRVWGGSTGAVEVYVVNEEIPVDAGL